MNRATLATLVAANLLPVAGVAWWGWQVGDVVMLYWAENLVIGIFNVLRMAIAAGTEDAESVFDPAISKAIGELSARALFIAIFVAHYGFFCYVHGSLLAHLFPPGGMAADQEPFIVLQAMVGDTLMLASLLAIVASHGFSYLVNYLGRKEYRKASLGDLMSSPYKRIVFTHVFILLGAFLVETIGSPLLAIILFVLLKTAFDGYAHDKERRALS